MTDWLLMASILFAGPCLIAWVLGDSMRYRRAYYANLEERAARLERDRDAQAQIAAAAERARIARELHDVVAHNVSVMVVQADGAAYALGTDPGRAREALAAISATGRQALAEMRVLLGVLRSETRPARPACRVRLQARLQPPGQAGRRWRRCPASASSTTCSTRPGPPGCRSPARSRVSRCPCPTAPRSPRTGSSRSR